MIMSIRRFLRSQCFAGCAPADEEYSEIEKARRITVGATELVEANLQDCNRRQRAAELTLVCCTQKMRVLAANIDNDPYPELLVYRLKMQMKEQRDAELELKLILKLTRQLHVQLTSMRASELNTGVMHTLKSILRCTTPQVRFAADCADELVEDITERNEEVAETTRILVHCASDDDDEDGVADDDDEDGVADDDVEDSNHAVLGAMPVVKNAQGMPSKSTTIQPCESV
jgi:hypothetical protein